MILSEATADGIAIDPDGIKPIAGSKCLRTLDVLDLCRNARRKTPTVLTPHDKGDLVQVTYGTIPVPDGDRRCFSLIWFIEHSDFINGQKVLLAYPQAATIWTLRRYFERGTSQALSCDPNEMATVVAEYNPWQ